MANQNDKPELERLFEKLTGRWATLIGIQLAVLGTILAFAIFILGYFGWHNYSDSRKAIVEMQELNARYQNAIKGTRGTWIEAGQNLTVVPNFEDNIPVQVPFSMVRQGDYNILFSQSSGVNRYNFRVEQKDTDGFIFFITNESMAGVSLDSGGDSVRVSWLAVGVEPQQ